MVTHPLPYTASSNANPFCEEFFLNIQPKLPLLYMGYNCPFIIVISQCLPVILWKTWVEPATWGFYLLILSQSRNYSWSKAFFSGRFYFVIRSKVLVSNRARSKKWWLLAPVGVYFTVLHWIWRSLFWLKDYLSLEKIVALQLRVNNLNGNIPVSLDPEAFNLMTWFILVLQLKINHVFLFPPPTFS